MKAKNLLNYLIFTLVNLIFYVSSFAQLTHVKFQVRVSNVQSNMGDWDGLFAGDSDFQWEFSGSASDGAPAISGSGCYEAGGNNNPNININNVFINQTAASTTTQVAAQWRARENDDFDCDQDDQCQQGWFNQTINIRSGSPCIWNNATQMVSGTTCGGQYRLTFAHYWEPVANSPSSITSSVPGTLCGGSATTLTAQFTDEATAGVTAETRWYTTGCNTTGHFATGNSISVTPSTTTTYYARRVITSACGNGNFSVSCASITVVVGGPTPTGVNAGADVTYCSPGSTNLNGSANVTTGPWTVGASPNLAIPDNNVTGATSTINIPSTCANANNLTSVTINLTHTWTSDLSIFLRAPNLSQIDLSSGNGGSGDNYTNTVFSTAGTAITSGVAPFTGTYTPEQAFSNLTGTAQGDWSLRVVDGAGGDVGNIVSWSITISNPTCGVVSYTWSPGTGLSSTTIANPTASPTTTTNYTLTATYNGCSATDQVLVTVNQPSTPPTSITGTTTICLGGSTTLTLFGGSSGTGAIPQWFAGSCGGILIGTGSSITVSPTATTAYFVRYAGTCNTTTCANTTVTVNTLSTAPTITPIVGTVCPNTNNTLTATGGTAGTGSVIRWYTGPNGTGSLVGTGGSIVVTPSVTTTYYARREGTCNTTADVSTTVNVKNFGYATNGTTTSNYCTDNAGWHHFYSGDEIIFSVQGDLSSIGTFTATIFDNGAYYQQTEGPGTAPGCTSNENPNEERFEMERSWNVDYTGSLIGSYNIRFYYPPAERTAIEAAANAWLAAYPDCGYGYKYLTPNGFYWFKNSGSSYTAPDYDGTHYSATVSSVSGVNYAQWTGISSFSGGSGAIILEPISILPIELSSFAAICNETGDKVKIQWATATENNTSHFDVERSLDGANWEILGTTLAAGNSTSIQTYSMDDYDVRGHEVIYYRLNQLDQDGLSKLYGPTSAECTSNLNGLELFPNPAGTEVSLLLHGDYAEGTEVIFTDMHGKEVKKIIYSESVGKLMIVDLRNLEPGVYLVKVKSHVSNSQFVRLIKQ